MKKETPYDLMSEDNIITITHGKSNKDVKIRSANDFIKAVKEGKSLEKASEEVGITYNDQIKARLEQLSVLKMTANDEMKAVINARMMEIVLGGENSESIAAAKVLTQNPELGMGGGSAALVNINVSDEIMKLEPGQLKWEKSEEKEK